jgi:hypothetical protein
MKPTLFLVVALLGAGCTMNGPDAEPAAMAAATGAAEQCIPIDQIISRRPAGPQSITFEMVGGRHYRNDLPEPCPGLQRAGTAEIVQVEATGSRLCRDDRVRVYDPVEARNIGLAAFPHCRLGAFKPVPQP